MWKGPSLGFLFSFIKGQLPRRSAFLKGCKIKLQEQILIFTQILSIYHNFNLSGCLPGILKRFKNACNYADTVPYVAAIISV